MKDNGSKRGKSVMKKSFLFSVVIVGIFCGFVACNAKKVDEPTEISNSNPKEELNQMLLDGTMNKNITWSRDNQFVVYATTDLADSDGVNYGVFITSVDMTGEVQLLSGVTEIPEFNWRDGGLVIKYDGKVQKIKREVLTSIKEGKSYTIEE